jgi:hypothetical protein
MVSKIMAAVTDLAWERRGLNEIRRSDSVDFSSGLIL